MAFLDLISCKPNEYSFHKWANNKYGAIKPNKDGKFIFYECQYDKDNNVTSLLYPAEYEEFLTPIAYGFVSYWLRKRRMKRTDQKDTFGTRYLTPKEIYYLYINERKSEYFEMMGSHTNGMTNPYLEKLFYEQNLTVDGEAEQIALSQPLLDYLDIEDVTEYYDVMANFLDYVKSIVEPYQKMQEDNDGPEIELSPEEELFEKYKDSIESVFLETYRFCEQEYKTYPNVKEAFRLCIDPNEPTQVPVFIEACIKKKCVRESARLQPENIVKALIGLGLKEFEDDNKFKNFRDSVGRKIKRLTVSQMSVPDHSIYDSVYNRLSRPIEGTLIEK